MDSLQYKGYTGSMVASIEDRCIWGKILYITDLVDYEAQTVDELEKEFKLAVDDYLDDCMKFGREPAKPCKGSFNVRIGEDRHKKAAIMANREKTTINNIIVKALDEYFVGQSEKKTVKKRLTEKD